jgi:hypothetical protein
MVSRSTSLAAEEIHLLSAACADTDGGVIKTGFSAALMGEDVMIVGARERVRRLDCSNDLVTL